MLSPNTVGEPIRRALAVSGIRRALDIFMEHILTGGWNSESKSSHLNGCRTTNATGPVAQRHEALADRLGRPLGTDGAGLGRKERDDPASPVAAPWVMVRLEM